MKITIDTHYCSREELAELKEYLEEKCWDFRTDEKEEEVKPIKKQGGGAAVKFKTKYPISVAVALERDVIYRRWDRLHKKYFWYAESGDDRGHGTGLEALAEYYDIVAPEREERERLEIERALRARCYYFKACQAP